MAFAFPALRRHLGPQSPSWALAEAALLGLFSFVSLVAIGRIIGPEAAGTATYALAPFYLLDVSTTALFTESLVQHRALRARHANSAATAAVALGSIGGIALAAAAPLLAALAASPQVTPLVLALAPLLPVSALASVASGLLLRGQRYRLLSLRVLIGQPLTLSLCILAAQAGLGPWALVGQPIVLALATATLVFGFGGLGIRPCLDLAAVRELLPVALPQFAAAVLEQAKYRLLVLVLGMLTTEAIVGQVHFAHRMVNGAITPVWILMSRLSLPRLCQMHNSRPGIARAFGELGQLQALLGLAVAAGVALVAPDVVSAFLGPSWSGTAAAARIYGITEAVVFTVGPWIQLFIAVGQADRNFRLNLAHLALLLATLAIVRPVTPEAVAVVWAVPFALMLPRIAFVSIREVRRPWRWWLRQIAPALFATAAMSVSVIALQRTVTLPPGPELLLSAATGAVVFALAAWAALGRRKPPALAWQPAANAPAE